MMGSVGLSVDELQRAAPIVSGFLLGYVAMLPLIGRIADLRGRTPVLVAALVVFAFGSLVTAAAYDLASLVAGRFLQGVGGGGLVPVTLALVADLYPADRRGVPLGVVGAVQELGSVLGPLYGAVVLSFGTWRDIFWINLAVGLVLAAGDRHPGPAAVVRGAAADAGPAATLERPRLDWVGLAAARAAPGRAAAGDAAAAQPGHLGRPGRAVRAVPGRRRRSGGPSSGWSRSSSALVLLAWLLLARRPLVDLRDWWRSVREADLVGAALLSVGLGGMILAFATADPEVQVFSPAGPWYLAVAARRRRAVRAAQPPRRGSARPARCLRAAARLGCAAGQLLRRRGADRGAGRHPDLRPDHRRRRLADQGRAGAGGVPGRPAGRRARRRRADPAAARRRRRRRRHGCWRRSASG